MITSRGTCEFCHQEVLSNHQAAFRIRGWEVEREQGGANSILGRERQADRIVHAFCVKRFEKVGHQGDLL